MINVFVVKCFYMLYVFEIKYIFVCSMYVGRVKRVYKYDKYIKNAYILYINV